MDYKTLGATLTMIILFTHDCSTTRYRFIQYEEQDRWKIFAINFKHNSQESILK